MSQRKYHSVDELFADVHEPLKPIVKKIRKLFMQYAQVEELLQWNCFVYKFPGIQRCKPHWCYLNTYKKKKSVIVGFGQGAAIVKKNPLMRYAFDEIKEVVAKVEIFSEDDIDKKSLAELIKVAIKYHNTIKEKVKGENV